MRLARDRYCAWLAAACVVVAGCSDDSGITDPKTALPNYIRLESDAGDYIGGGQSYEYTQADAVIDVTATDGFLSMDIRGDEYWSADIQMPSGVDRIEVGSFTYGHAESGGAGFNWSGEGRGCGRPTGSFVVESVVYDNEELTVIDLGFEQLCEGSEAALHGDIHWRSGDPTVPPGPVNPVPAGLWEPAPGSMPPTGSYIYLKSDAGDYIGDGVTYTYTPADTDASFTAGAGHLLINVAGWIGTFEAMSTLSVLEPGYYGDLRRWPFHNPTKGGLDWSGQGRGCNELVGWFAIDGIAFSEDRLTALDLRFEQSCDGAPAALHGAIHFVS